VNVKDVIMNIQKIKQLLYHDVPLRILSYISVHHGAVLSADEIRKKAGTSKGGTNQTLRLLVELGMLSREKKGNVFIYKINSDNFILKQFKIFENVLKLQGLVERIKKYSYEIILFGSCAAGTNGEDSDIDIFVRTEENEKVAKLINKYEPGKIKAIINDTLEHAELKTDDNVLYNQILKGITLWKGKPSYEEI
jgi:predicted nucleotidyltransferase